jgi:hypothetical protein
MIKAKLDPAAIMRGDYDELETVEVPTAYLKQLLLDSEYAKTVTDELEEAKCEIGNLLARLGREVKNGSPSPIRDSITSCGDDEKRTPMFIYVA